MRPRTPSVTSPQVSHPHRGGDAVAIHERFRRLAHTIAYAIGTPSAFLVAAIVVIAWAVTGPIFHYSDTWQLVINTSTTIVTFLVVFLIQNTQNRDSQAIHLKLDELIRAMKTARNVLMDIEDRPDEEFARLQREMQAVRDELDPPAAGGERSRPGGSPTGSPTDAAGAHKDKPR